MSIRTEAGQGGRKGHSNMSHWSRTAEVKALARTARRADDRRAAAEAFVPDEDETVVLVQVEEEEPTCYCRRCFLHDDPGGCVALEDARV